MNPPQHEEDGERTGRPTNNHEQRMTREHYVPSVFTCLQYLRARPVSGGSGGAPSEYAVFIVDFDIILIQCTGGREKITFGDIRNNFHRKQILK